MTEQEQRLAAQEALLSAWRERMDDVTTLDLRTVVNVLVRLGMERDTAVEAVVKIAHDALRNAPPL